MMENFVEEMVSTTARKVMEPVLEQITNVQEQMEQVQEQMEQTREQMTEQVITLKEQMKQMTEQMTLNLKEQMKQMTEQVTLTFLKQFNRTPRTSLGQDDKPDRSYHLWFDNKLPSTIFTNRKIKDESDEYVKIVLFNTISKKPVTSGPLSSIKIQILVLDGDFGFEAQENWSEQDFIDKVVSERDGKRPLVTGERNIMLIDGVGIISDLFFTDNSSWIKGRKFRLGASVGPFGGQVSIKGAISEAFEVKDYRGEVYKKHHPPSLDDEVWRLKRIRKDGKYHQQLASLQINTVQDFLRMHETDSMTLKEELCWPKGAWDTIVEHASTCGLNDEIFYTYSVGGIGLLFNSVYKLVEATFDGQNYRSVEDPTFIDTSDVERLKEQAYRNISSFVRVRRPEFPVVEQGLAEMQINCNNATTSSFYMGGSENPSHQLQPPYAEDTHPIQESDQVSGFFSDEFVEKLASEVACPDLMPTWSPFTDDATCEHNNGFNLPSTSSDPEFGHAADAHGTHQAVDPMSTRSPHSATRFNSHRMSNPTFHGILHQMQWI